MRKTKVVLRLLNEAKNKPEWVHLCYVDTDLYNKYMAHFKLTSLDLNSIVARWITEDFNLDRMMSRKADLDVFKAVLKDYYSRVYPEIYSQTDTDRQGWVRVFVTKKMKEDLGPYGE